MSLLWAHAYRGSGDTRLRTGVEQSTARQAVSKGHGWSNCAAMPPARKLRGCHGGCGNSARRSGRRGSCGDSTGGASKTRADGGCYDSPALPRVHGGCGASTVRVLNRSLNAASSSAAVSRSAGSRLRQRSSGRFSRPRRLTRRCAPSETPSHGSGDPLPGGVSSRSPPTSESRIASRDESAENAGVVVSSSNAITAIDQMSVAWAAGMVAARRLVATAASGGA